MSDESAYQIYTELAEHTHAMHTANLIAYRNGPGCRPQDEAWLEEQIRERLGVPA